jgi:hypothetical protein
LENLNKLFEFIGLIDKNIRISYFLFCGKDIGFLIENKLFFDDSIKKKMRTMKLQRTHKIRLDNLANLFLNEISQLRWTGRKSKPEKLCTIEAYIGLDDIEIKENQQFTSDIADENLNIRLVNNFRKNIFTLAFLNDQIYKNNNITKIITTNAENEYNVNVSIKIIKHNFDNIRCKNINISNCNVLNCNLKTLKRPNFISIDDALKFAERDFKDTVEYSTEIYKSIDEYEEILAKLRADRHTDIDGIVEIDNFKREYPFIVYDCINILDKLVKLNRPNEISNNPQHLSKHFICDSFDENEICNRCRGYLRLCGFSCAIENTILTIDGKPYQIHLRPYTKMKGTKYFEKSLRIYFRWDTDKIEIGYIGKHL